MEQLGSTRDLEAFTGDVRGIDRDDDPLASRPCTEPVGRAPRVAAYLAVQDPSCGTACLFEQLRDTDTVSARLGAASVTRFVDSGSRTGADGIGPSLAALSAAVAAGAFDAVAVQHLSRFAADYMDALRFAVELASTGIAIVEAHGGRLHVDEGEAALIRGVCS